MNLLQKQMKPVDGLKNLGSIEDSSRNKLESALYLTYSSKIHYVLYNLGTVMIYEMIIENLFGFRRFSSQRSTQRPSKYFQRLVIGWSITQKLVFKENLF